MHLYLGKERAEGVLLLEESHYLVPNAGKLTDDHKLQLLWKIFPDTEIIYLEHLGSLSNGFFFKPMHLYLGKKKTEGVFLLEESHYLVPNARKLMDERKLQLLWKVSPSIEIIHLERPRSLLNSSFFKLMHLYSEKKGRETCSCSRKSILQPQAGKLMDERNSNFSKKFLPAPRSFILRARALC